VTGVHGLDGRWNWNPNDLTIAGVDVSTQGQSYTAESLALEPTVQQLEDAGAFVPPSVSHDLFVPFDAPKIITDTARKVTAGATNAYEKAVDLQNYFQYGGFNYSTVAPVRDSYDGDSMRSIAAFLKVKSGYCVHFASAMAVMARTLGIPARIAMGYLPGSVTGTRDNRQLLQVTSDELHAWPELYFSGVGWVPFEPTVSRGTLPAYSIPGSSVTSDPSSSAPAPERSSAALPPTDPTNGAPGSVSTASQELGSIVSTVAVLLFAIALLLTPAGVRRGLRMSRLRKLADEWGSPRLAWKELQQTARDLGMAVADTETPRSFAARVAGVLGDDAAAIAALQSLLDATEREEYGRPGHGIIDPDRATQLRAVLTAMLREAGLADRMRAFLVPVSLLPTTTGFLRGRERLSA
jgi:transglutaminase-like putative cysteine protease